MTNRSRGFTVVEMMVVIAIIGILSTLAIPSFQGRIIRKQIDAAMPLADVAQKPIADSWASAQVFPADNSKAGIPAADKIVNNFVSSVQVENGAVHIAFGNRAHGPIAGKVISLRPAVVADEPMVPVTWVCGKADPPGKMTVNGVDKTTVPDLYLPLDCRNLKR